MMARPFSYAEYKGMVLKLSKNVPLLDFTDVTEKTERFCILRHDVEFHVPSAYELAKIEKNELGLTTSYFFQLRNNTYNSMSKENIALIKKIQEMGHKIGLHVHLGGWSGKDLKEYVSRDIEMLEWCLGIPIDRFSFHRPNLEVLEMNLKVPGKINVYSPRYFHFYKNERPEKLNVCYLADSKHRWAYGHPNIIIEQEIKRSQILVHPYSWSEKGFRNKQNFKNLLKNKNKVLRESINSECRHFPERLL